MRAFASSAFLTAIQTTLAGATQLNERLGLVAEASRPNRLNVGGVC